MTTDHLKNTFPESRLRKLEINFQAFGRWARQWDVLKDTLSYREMCLISQAITKLSTEVLVISQVLKFRFQTLSADKKSVLRQREIEACLGRRQGISGWRL